MKLEASCTVTASIEDISVNSIELAAIQGEREAAYGDIKEFEFSYNLSYHFEL